MSDSKFVRHVPCPSCGSSDSGALYTDGHVFCFGRCRRIVTSPGESLECSDADEVGNYGEYKALRCSPSRADERLYSPPSKSVKYKPMTQENVIYKGIPERGITKETCEKYGVQVSVDQHLYPYHDGSGAAIASKTRYVKAKEFSASGDLKGAVLFGQHLFQANGKYVTIVEGELDALAAFQMTGSQWPVVSIKNGASAAVKDCTNSFDWLNSFDNVIIAFDADEPGRKAAQEVAELFGPKAKIVKHAHGFKDPCDYLAAGATKQYVDSWWRAEAYKPDGIINGQDLWEELQKPQQKPDAQWPYKTLNEMLGGLRKRELVTIAAGTGQGKSTFLRQLIHHLLRTTDDKIGMAFLEESPQRTALGLMSIEAQKALHLPDTEYTQEELKAAYASTLGTGRCVLFNHFGSLDINNVLNRLRFMVKGMGCQWIILDHYQMILSGMDTDERKGLDMLLTKLRTFVEETGVGLFGVSHTRRIDGNKGLENGAEITLSSLRGTQGISQLSDAVVGLQRDQQADDPKVRNTTEVRLLKSRFTGETGPAGLLYFNKQTNRLEETDGVEAL